MRTSEVSGARRLGRLVIGLGSLAVLVGALFGGPVALLELAGNPLPDHVPGLAEIGITLTSRDDGQLFLRILALVGWAGWATFVLSVLLELPARVLRRSAIRLPGLGRQQRLAATLVGAVAMIVVASPAATAATAIAGPTVATATSPQSDTVISGTTLADASAPGTALADTSTPDPALAFAGRPGAGNARLSTPVRHVATDPVYRVEKDDYLGHVASRYLGDFNRYPELARLNQIHNPDRIQPGQLLHLPPTAEDHGLRRHATGLVAVPPQDSAGAAADTGSAPTAPPGAPTPAPAESSSGENDRTTYAVGASHSTEIGQLNRPLAVSAVIAVASMIGAQIGAVLGLRRQPDPGRHRRLES